MWYAPPCAQSYADLATLSPLMSYDAICPYYALGMVMRCSCKGPACFKTAFALDDKFASTNLMAGKITDWYRSSGKNSSGELL